MKNSHALALTTSLALCLFANTAVAQYVWIDDKGGKQYSDMPPPANVPKNRILKQPHSTSSTVQPETPTHNETVKPNAVPKTIAEQNADFRKRRAEQSENDKKNAVDAQRNSERVRNCEHARTYLQALESGQRIAQINKDGENAFMSDDRRDKEIRETKRILSECQY